MTIKTVSDADYRHYKNLGTYGVKLDSDARVVNLTPQQFLKLQNAIGKFQQQTKTVKVNLHGETTELQLSNAEFDRLYATLNRLCHFADSDTYEPGSKQDDLLKATPIPEADANPAASEIREWARLNGHEMPAKGKISAEIHAQFADWRKKKTDADAEA